MAKPIGMDTVAGLARRYLAPARAQAAADIDRVLLYGRIATDTPTAWAPRRGRLTALPEPDPLEDLLAAAGVTRPPVNRATLQDADHAARVRAHVRARWADAVADRGDDDEADMVAATMADASTSSATVTLTQVRAAAHFAAQAAAPVPFQLTPEDACRRAGLGYARTLWSAVAVVPPAPSLRLLGGAP